MKFRRDEPGARASGTLSEPASIETVELDLYDELSSFSALSPEEQRKELERVALASASPAVASGEPAPASFEFMDQPDLRAHEGSESNSSYEPAFKLIEESLLTPPDQPPGEPSQPVLALIEEQAQEPAHPVEESQVAGELVDTLRKTSPLDDIYSGVMATPETSLKCGSCSADSNVEDLFCPSCGQLLSEMDL
jgi:hypothetical protein